MTGFDLLPEMIQAAREVTGGKGVEAELFVADARTLDLPGRRFEAIYLTPLLYSFIAGRAGRVEMLRRFRQHLAPTGCILLSAKLERSAADRAQTLLAWLRRRLIQAPASEFGDWYTWFLTPSGTIGYSFLHRFSARAVTAEVRAAGFRRVERHQAHVLASDAESR